MILFASRVWRRRSLGIVLLLAPAVLVAVWFGLRHFEQRTARSSGIESANATIGFRWQPGTRLSYAFESRVTLLADDVGGAQETVVRGLYHLHVLARDAESARIAVQLGDPTVEGADGRATALERVLRESVAYVQVAQSGRVLSIATPRHLAREDREVLTRLFRIQVVLPESEASRTPQLWETREHDDLGEYVAEYDAAPGGRLHKRRLRYTQTSMSPEFDFVIDSSSSNVELGGSWLKSLHAEEAFRTSFGGQVLLRARTALTLTALAEVAPGAALWSLTRAGMDAALSDTHAALEFEPSPESGEFTERKRAELARRYEHVPLKEVLDPLLAKVATAKRHADALAELDSMRDWLLVHPEQAQQLVEVLRTRIIEPDVSAYLVHALELASDHPEAQIALGELMLDTTLADTVRVQAMIAAGGVKRSLDPVLEEALWSLAPGGHGNSELDSAALLNLGVLASERPDVASRLDEEYGALLEAPAEEASLIQENVLYALANGNIGGETNISRAEQLLRTAEDSNVRCAAVEYLGRVAESPPEVLRAALRDPAPRVQTRAMDALLSEPYLGPTNLLEIATVARRPDTVDAVRQHAIFSLAKHLGKQPALREVFVDIRSQTNSPELQSAIDAALRGEELEQAEPSSAG
jgi:hypothetical protein